jgi:transcriptional regulator GlxA family with amidase domain
MNIAILLIPEALSSTITGPLDVLITASFSAIEHWRVKLVATTLEPVSCFSGLKLTPNKNIEGPEVYDLIIVPSLIISPAGLLDPHPKIGQWLRAQAAQGAKVASICTGAFLVAESGLLKHQRATTHWAFAETFRRLYPDVELDSKQSLINNGSTLSCAAGTAWQDLVLFIIRRYISDEVSLGVSQSFQLQTHNAGQSPFCGITPTQQHDSLIAAAKQGLKERSADHDCLQQVMQESGLNQRTFQRRFKKSTGLSAGHFLQVLRIEKTKEKLLFSTATIETISQEVGYEDTSYLRRIFKKETGLSLSEYRKRYQTSKPIR